MDGNKWNPEVEETNGLVDEYIQSVAPTKRGHRIGPVVDVCLFGNGFGIYSFFSYIFGG